VKVNKVKKIQNNDFTVVLTCEFCLRTQEVFSVGGNDTHFQKMILPKIKCDKCGRSTKP
jgi:C4-type Zn-finger protein